MQSRDGIDNSSNAQARVDRGCSGLASRYAEGYAFAVSGVYAAFAHLYPHSVDDFERGQRAGNLARQFGVSLA